MVNQIPRSSPKLRALYSSALLIMYMYAPVAAVVKNINKNFNPPAFHRDRGVTPRWALSMLFTSLSQTWSFCALRRCGTGSFHCACSYPKQFAPCVRSPLLTSCEMFGTCFCRGRTGLDLASLPERGLSCCLTGSLDSPHPFCLYCTRDFWVCQYFL